MATELQEHLLSRRLNEILAYTNQNGMTVDLTTEDISWELGPLLQTGVIHKVAELSVSKTAREFLNKAPPMFEIPNESRMPYEHYYDEEDFADENFMDEENLNVEFADPYEGYPVWNGPSDNNENNRMGPKPVPVFFDDGDGRVMESDYQQAQRADGVEALAWYAPMNVSESGWGIFIRKGSAAYLAEHRFGDMESRYEAWILAMKVLVAHEYFHYLSQYHCDRLSIDMPSEEKYLRYFGDWMRNPAIGVEEAVANAFALSKTAKKEKNIVGKWFDTLPHPYSAYKPYTTMKGLARGKAHLAAQQEYFAKYVEDDINPSSGQRYDPKPLVPVPIFIVDDTHPGTPGPKMVSFDDIHIHKKVLKSKRSGSIPADVWNAFLDFINELRGNSFDRLSKHGFVRTKNKSLWRFELPRKFRGYMTQISDRNGWSVVFVGKHADYDKFSKKHGCR